MARIGFWHIAEDHPERVALILPLGEHHNFGELLAQANRFAHGLRALGLAPGDGVVVALHNGATYYALHLAAMQTGLYFTAANTHLTAAELAWIIEDSEASVAVASPDLAATVAEAADLAKLAPERRFADGEATAGLRALSSLGAGQPATLPGARVPGKVMAYTSGTTGRPTGIRRPIRPGDPSEVAAEATGYASGFGLVPFDGINLVEGPLYHAAPSGLSWGSLHLGHTQVVTSSFDAEETIALIERHRVTSANLVTTMFHRLLRLPEHVRRKYDVSSLRMVLHSASPCPVEIKQRMMEWWGPVLWEVYGGTEGTGTRVDPETWLAHPGTVGRAIENTRILILDDEDRECPPGAAGRIFIEKPHPFEYWKDAEKTRAAHRGTAFHLGDIGYLDEEGLLYLTGRANEVIISGGVNIYPAEIESRLLAHPAVADVAVVGAPDEEWGERVVAIVEPTLEHADDEKLPDELLAFCREGLARFKCPREVQLRRELPRDENGKLYRRQLRDALWDGQGRWI